ncbi:MAG TPA: hypothetical protein VK815_12925 [Candidatus Acidoferrales bacterium]|nr:hypothetical protein [Candidatus Acidoferrales bacterium]
MSMRFTQNIFAISLLVPLLAQAQPAPQLPPGGVAQIMTPQPVVDTSPLENISTTAIFDPPTVRVGEKTFYRVTVDATQNSVDWPDEISTPSELKLDAGVRGQISRVEGNRFFPLTSFVYEVTPAATGRFSISNFVVQANGKSVTIPAATLDVTDGNSAPTPPARQLLLEVSGTNLFVGQPVRVRVLLPSGAGNQIESVREIQFNGSGFMTDKIATRQSVEMVNQGGQQKTAYIFETSATPLAAGSVGISAQGFTAGHDFGGAITISGGGQVVISGGSPKYVLLVSDETRLNVRPLPAEGELPGFTGTIGMFRPDKPQLSSTQMHVGEPVHLRYNFQPATSLARFVPPEAPRSREWQIIADPPPGNGFTLIPLTDEAESTPAIPFSGFDPATEKYYDLTIPTVPVTVSGDGLPVQLPVWSSTETNPAPLKLSGLAATPGKIVGSLKPLQLQGWFVCLQILPVLAFIALWRWDERRRFLEAHPDIVRRRKAKRDLRREKIKMDRAASAGDADTFARHAAASLRIAIAPHVPADAQALVGADVLSQMDEADRRGPAGETVRKFFATTDVRFAATAQSHADLLGLRADVDAVLQKLEEKL